ncbi:murein biosynthesis integral membrane protein MurJ [Arcanobacterium ihumii]|uniref:murein biosynthesis integral membrane protein MurJ n=1 Tax=Arcanobacterium ihumii TaxID=2138162 RepID=UPI000F546F77|nr:lipid II flippase MurJ [Arcanobacterium ihumii]
MRQSPRHNPRHASGDAPLFPRRRPRVLKNQQHLANLGANSATTRQQTQGDPQAKTSGPSSGFVPPTSASDQESFEQNLNTATKDAGQSSPSVARSSFIMFLGTFTSRILGLVRSPILLGAVLGLTSPVANSFDIANRLPTLIYMIIAGGLVNAVLVPAIVRASQNTDDDGEAFINKLLTITIVVLGIITAVLTVCSPLIVKAFAATLDPQWYHLTVIFAYWCMPQIFFYGLYTVLGQILNAKENFGPFMWAPALNNVVAIAGLLIILGIYGGANPASPDTAQSWMGMNGMLLGGFSTLGIAAQALILVLPLRKIGIRFRFDFAWRNSGLGNAGKASGWMLALMVLSILPTALLSNVAANATQRALDNGEGVVGVAGNSVYTAAYTLYSLPTSLITVSIATAIFTQLAKSAAKKDYRSVQADTSLTLRTVSTFNFLAISGILVLAVPASRLLGFFVSAAEVRALAPVLMVMSLGLLGVGFQTVLNRVYFAFENTRAVFLINVPINLFLAIGYVAAGFLPPHYVVVGIAGIMAFTNTAAGCIMYLHLRHTLGGLDEKNVLATHAKLVAISIATVAVGEGMIFIFGGSARLASSQILSFIAITVVGIAMVGVFFGLMFALKMGETAPIRKSAQKAISKFKR